MITVEAEASAVFCFLWAKDENSSKLSNILWEWLDGVDRADVKYVI